MYVHNYIELNRVEPSNELPATGANIFGHLAIRVAAQVQQKPDEVFATAASQRHDKLQNFQLLYLNAIVQLLTEKV